MGRRLVIVPFSGGVTSAWCAGWALRNYPKEEIVLLWHDTKEEDPDTYRFLREMAAKFNLPITERSDGRSVTQVFYDEEFLGNNQNAMCSRILKREQGDRFVREVQAADALGLWLSRSDEPPVEIIKVVGYSAEEPKRVAHMIGICAGLGITPRFPVVEERVTKQQCADWCNCTMGVKPSAMYEWSEHANCLGCVKGGRAYWLAVHKHHPDVFNQRADMEEEFGHSILRGELRKGEERAPFLRELVQIGLKRRVSQREKIQIGACDCGD